MLLGPGMVGEGHSYHKAARALTVNPASVNSKLLGWGARKHGGKETSKEALAPEAAYTNHLSHWDRGVWQALGK